MDRFVVTGLHPQPSETELYMTEVNLLVLLENVLQAQTRLVHQGYLR